MEWVIKIVSGLAQEVSSPVGVTGREEWEVVGRVMGWLPLSVEDPVLDGHPPVDRLIGRDVSRWKAVDFPPVVGAWTHVDTNGRGAEQRVRDLADIQVEGCVGVARMVDAEVRSPVLGAVAGRRRIETRWWVQNWEHRDESVKGYGFEVVADQNDSSIIGIWVEVG